MAISYRLDNSTTLNLAGAWSLGVPSTANVGQWGSGSTNILNNASTAIGASISYGGIIIAGVQTTPVTIGITGGSTLSLSSSGIDMSAAGADLTISTPLIYLAPQSASIAAGRTLNILGGRAGNFLNTITGSGRVVLANTSSNTVGIALTGSTLVINNAAAIGTSAARLFLNSGIISSSVATTLNGSLLTIGGNFLYTGSVDFSFGVGATTLLVTPTITVANSGRTLTLAGIISGSGFGITKDGPGNLTLSAVNTYTGPNTFTSGVVSISADTNLGAAPASAATNIILNNTTLRITAAITLNANRNMTINSGLSYIDNTAAVTYGGIISGNGDLTKLGVGTLTLSGTNTYTGITTISAGTASVSRDANFGSVPVSPITDIIFNGGSGLISTATTILHANRNINIQTDTVFAPATGTSLGISGSISGSSRLILNGAGTLNLAGINSQLGSFTLTAGTLGIYSENALGNSIPVLTAGSIIIGSNTTINGLTGVTTALNVGVYTLTVNIPSGQSLSHGGVISGNSAGIISIQGGGTQTFTGNNTFPGLIDVTQGVIRASTSAGALGTGTANVRLRNSALGIEFIGAAALAFSRDIILDLASAYISLDKLAAGVGVAYTMGRTTLPSITNNEITFRTGSNINSGTGSYVSTILDKPNLSTYTSSLYIYDNAEAQFNAHNASNFSNTVINKYGNGRLTLQETTTNQTTAKNFKLNIYDGVLSLGGAFSQQYLENAILSSSVGLIYLEAPVATINNSTTIAPSVQVFSDIFYRGSNDTTYDGTGAKFILKRNNLKLNIATGRTLQFSGGPLGGFVPSIPGVSASNATLIKEGGGILTIANTAAYNTLAGSTLSPSPPSFLTINGGTVNIGLMDSVAANDYSQVTYTINSGSILNALVSRDAQATVLTYNIYKVILNRGSLTGLATSVSYIESKPELNITNTISMNLRSNSLSIYGVIDLQLNGLGTTVLNGANSSATANSTGYTSCISTVLNSGTLSIGNAYALGGGFFDYDADVYPENISQLYIRGGQVNSTVTALSEPIYLILQKDLIFTGSTSLSTYKSNTARWGNYTNSSLAQTLGGAFDIRDNLTFTFVGCYTDLTAALGSSNLGLTKKGTGTLVLDIRNTISTSVYNSFSFYINEYYGPTYISGGTLAVYGDNNVDTGLGDYALGWPYSSASNIYINDDSKLLLYSTMDLRNRKLYISGSATLQTDGTTYLSGAVYGSGSFIKTGAGTFTVGTDENGSNNRQYYITGSTSIQAGVYRVYSDEAFGHRSSSIIIGNGTLQLFNNFDINRTFYLNGTAGNLTLPTSTGTSSIASLCGLGATSTSGLLNKLGTSLLIINSASNSQLGYGTLSNDAGYIKINHSGALRGIAIDSVTTNGFDLSSINSLYVGGLNNLPQTFAPGFILNIETKDRNYTCNTAIGGTNLTFNKYGDFDQYFTVPFTFTGSINIYGGKLSKQDNNGFNGVPITIYSGAIGNAGTNNSNITLYSTSVDDAALIGGIYNAGTIIDCTAGSVSITTAPTIYSKIILPYGQSIRFDSTSVTISGSEYAEVNGNIYMSTADLGIVSLTDPNFSTPGNSEFAGATFICTTAGAARTTPRLYINGSSTTSSFYANLRSETVSTPFNVLDTPLWEIYAGAAAANRINFYGTVDTGFMAGLDIRTVVAGDSMHLYNTMNVDGWFRLISNIAASDIHIYNDINFENRGYYTVFNYPRRALLYSIGNISFWPNPDYVSSTGTEDYRLINIYGNTLDINGVNLFLYTDLILQQNVVTDSDPFNEPILGLIKGTTEIRLNSKRDSTNLNGYSEPGTITFGLGGGYMDNALGLSTPATNTCTTYITDGVIGNTGFINNYDTEYPLIIYANLSASNARTINSVNTALGIVRLDGTSFFGANANYTGAPGLVTLSYGIVEVGSYGLSYLPVSVGATLGSLRFINPTVYLGSIRGAGNVNVRYTDPDSLSQSGLDLEIGADNISTTYSGILSGLSTSNITKVGTGTWTLSNTSYGYAGGIYIAGGTISLAGATTNAAPYIINGNIDVDSGAVLSISAASVINFGNNAVSSNSTDGKIIVNSGGAAYMFKHGSTSPSTNLYVTSTTMFSSTAANATSSLQYTGYFVPRYASTTAGRDDAVTFGVEDAAGSYIDFGDSPFNWTNANLYPVIRVNGLNSTLRIGGNINTEGSITEAAYTVRLTKNGFGRLILGGTYNDGGDQYIVDTGLGTTEGYIWLREGSLAVKNDAILGWINDSLTGTTTKPRFYFNANGALSNALDPFSTSPAPMPSLVFYGNSSFVLSSNRVFAFSPNGNIIDVQGNTKVYQPALITTHDTAKTGAPNAFYKKGSGAFYFQNSANIFPYSVTVYEGIIGASNISYTTTNNSFGTIASKDRIYLDFSNSLYPNYTTVTGGVEYIGPIDGVNNGATGNGLGYTVEAKLSPNSNNNISFISNASSNSTSNGMNINLVYNTTYNSSRWTLNLSGNTGNNFLAVATPGISGNPGTSSVVKDGDSSWTIGSLRDTRYVTINKGTLKFIGTYVRYVLSESQFNPYGIGDITINNGEFHISSSTTAAWASCGNLVILTGSIRASSTLSALSCSGLTTYSASIYTGLWDQSGYDNVGKPCNITHQSGNLELWAKNYNDRGTVTVNSGKLFLKAFGTNTGSFAKYSDLIASGNSVIDLGGYTTDIQTLTLSDCTSSNGNYIISAFAKEYNIVIGGSNTLLQTNISESSTGTNSPISMDVSLRYNGTAVLSGTNLYRGNTSLFASPTGGDPSLAKIILVNSNSVGVSTGNLTSSNATIVINNTTIRKNNISLGGRFTSSVGTSYILASSSFVFQAGARIGENIVWGGDCGFTIKPYSSVNITDVIISGTHSSSMTNQTSPINILPPLTRLKCANDYALGGATNGYREADSIYVSGTLQAANNTKLKISGSLYMASGSVFKFGGS
jgi:autotransporter-associated beta strand protein